MRMFLSAADFILLCDKAGIQKEVVLFEKSFLVQTSYSTPLHLNKYVSFCPRGMYLYLQT